MDRARPLNPVTFLAVLVVGIATLVHFAPNVRPVDAVGLSGGGAAIGATRATSGAFRVRSVRL
jgi:hypothetical protein